MLTVAVVLQAEPWAGAGGREEPLLAVPKGVAGGGHGRPRLLRGALLLLQRRPPTGPQHRGSQGVAAHRSPPQH